MTDTMKALDEIEAALNTGLTWMPRRGYDMSKEIAELKAALSLLPTLRAALAPAADDEIDAIRGRHEAADTFESDGLDSAEWRASLTMLATKAHADRATLLSHVARLTAELEAERSKAGEWRTMESAPKDGRYVLCRGHNGGVVESMQWLWNDDGKDGNWYWHEGDCPRTQPTHWMPLPTPPATLTKDTP